MVVVAGAKAVAAVEEEVEAVAEEEAEAEEEEATVVVAAVTKAVAAVVVAAAALAVAARVAEAEAEVASPLHPSCCPRIPRTTRGSHQTRARYQWRRQLLNRHGHCPQRAGARAESAPWLLSQPSTPSRGGAGQRPKCNFPNLRFRRKRGEEMFV